MTTIYLSGTMQNNEMCSRWRTALVDRMRQKMRLLPDHLRRELTFLDPYRGKEVNDVEKSNGMGLTNHICGDGSFVVRDLTDLEESDVLVVRWFDGDFTRLPIGTLLEVGIAIEKGMPILLIDDSENQEFANHPFFKKFAAKIVRGHEGAVEWLMWYTTPPKEIE